jgi:hypothetical protein
VLDSNLADHTAEKKKKYLLKVDEIEQKSVAEFKNLINIL